jgi:hypothetical protein
MILKMHHVMVDGCGIVSLMANLVDDFDERYLPPMKKYTLKQRIVLNLAAPFYFIKLSLQFMFQPKDKNSIHNGKPLNGIKKAAIAKDFSIS